MINKERIFPKLNEGLSLKIPLCYYTTLNQSMDIFNNDPIFKLLNEYSNIEKIFSMNDIEITKFLYFNREYIDKILYQSEKIAHFKYDEKNENLSFYFYLNLLIKDDPEILNYTYDEEYIIKLNNKQKENENKYNKLILSKIIIELANDYKETFDYFNNEDEKKYNKIINDNLNIIQNYNNLIKELDIIWTKEDICSKNLEEIYILIINSLIKRRKFEDYEYTYNIINQLDLENINITKLMFKELYNILNSNEDYINDYIILNEEDLNSEKKINFYYILLKYILKNSIYIYQIPFLLKIRKNIKKIISNRKPSITSNDTILKRVEYIMNVFSETYIQLEIEKIKPKSKILNYFEEFQNNLNVNIKKEQKIENKNIKEKEIIKETSKNAEKIKEENTILTESSEKSTQIEVNSESKISSNDFIFDFSFEKIMNKNKSKFKNTYTFNILNDLYHYYLSDEL